MNMTPENSQGRPDGTELALQPDKPKTKIDAVREQLQANPNVYFAGEIHCYHSGAPENSYWTETVDLIVAPTIPQFDADELNVFMNSLITDVELSNRDSARSRFDGGLELGKLYYDETIGSISKVTLTTIETTEPEIIQRAERTVGESRSERQDKMQRRTWVRVYPDRISAAAAYEYENGVANGTVQPNNTHDYVRHWLTVKQVRRLKAQGNQSLISGVRGILHKGT